MKEREDPAPTSAEEQNERTAKDEAEVTEKKKSRSRPAEPFGKVNAEAGGRGAESRMADQAVVRRASISARASPSGMRGPKLRSK